MTSEPAMEEEDGRPSSPMSSTSWAVVGEPDSRSHNRPIGANRISFIRNSMISDTLSVDSNYGSSEGSITDVDEISSTSETPSLVTPSLTHTDDDYDDVEHEYEDEDELDNGSSAAIPSGWGSTPDLVNEEYGEGQRVAEGSRVYMQSDGWVSTSSLDELDNEDQDDEAPEVQGDEDSASTPIRFSQLNRLSEADRAALPEVISTPRYDALRKNAMSPPRPKPETGNHQDPNKQQKCPKQKTFLMKFMSLLDENMHEVIIPFMMLVICLFMAISLAMALGSVFMYLQPVAVVVFQGCAQLLGLSSRAHESVATGTIQTIITPIATPVLCENSPVFSTSPEGVQYLGSNSRARQNMDDFISQLSCANIQSKEETEDVQVHVVGDYHVIVRLPARLASGKNVSKFDIKVTRADKSLLFDLYKLFDGVFALRLAPEDAYGPVNVIVSSRSRPAINKTTNVDFGTPWLKIASWKKATQSLSLALRKNLSDAQNELPKVYIKLTFDFKNFRDIWGRNINQTTPINDSLHDIINLARNAVTKSKTLSNSLYHYAMRRLDSPLSKLKQKAKSAQQAVHGILSAAQERASRAQVPTFGFSLGAKSRDV
ncbi:hypothetical protein MferCBS31731_000893 [Microsporum ferrugineum]